MNSESDAVINCPVLSKKYGVSETELIGGFLIMFRALHGDYTIRFIVSPELAKALDKDRQ